jgi:hypothetical protein
MISYKYKCAFVHIPKCAGTSIDYTLNNNTRYYEWDGEWYLQHQTLSHMDIPDGYFKFSVIRHPIERMVSSYKFLSNECDGGTFNQFLTRSGGFTDILDPDKKHERDNRYHHIMSICDYIGDGSNLDMVIKMEDLSDKWEEVCDIIGHNLHLPHLNKSQNKQYNISMGDETIIRESYKKDFEYFGYK